MSDLSINLKKLRHSQRLTQREVAAKIGISQGNYSSIESGKVEPSLSTLIELAHFFGETLDTITGFMQYLDIDRPLPAEEEMWLELYRKMNLPERSLSLGMISVIQKHQENPFFYLPTQMEVIDFHEEYNKDRDDDDE